MQEEDTLATELEAMRPIARALDMLAHPDARQRVMRWAMRLEFAADFQRFAVEWQGA